ncbi:MAG: hypothetical protein HYZ53_15485 [Planctomycetes bacterium]|nr:hypothetical protein [Planctomycetota bacterium]
MLKLLICLAMFLAVACAGAHAQDAPAGDGSGDGDAWKEVRPGKTTAAELMKLVGEPTRRFKADVPRDGYDYVLEDPWFRDNPLTSPPDPKVPRVKAEVWVYTPKPDAGADARRPVKDTRAVLVEGVLRYVRTWPRAGETTLPAAKERYGKHPFKAEREVLDADILWSYAEYAWRQVGVVLLAVAKGDEDSRPLTIKLLVPAEGKDDGKGDKAGGKGGEEGR